MGSPWVSPPRGCGFGSRLIVRGLAHELDAEVRLEFLESGVRCAILFASARPSPRPDRRVRRHREGMAAPIMPASVRGDAGDGRVDSIRTQGPRRSETVRAPPGDPTQTGWSGSRA